MNHKDAVTVTLMALGMAVVVIAQSLGVIRITDSRGPALFTVLCGLLFRVCWWIDDLRKEKAMYGKPVMKLPSLKRLRELSDGHEESKALRERLDQEERIKAWRKEAENQIQGLDKKLAQAAMRGERQYSVFSTNIEAELMVAFQVFTLLKEQGLEPELMTEKDNIRVLHVLVRW